MNNNPLCGEKLYFSFINQKYRTNEIYVQQRKRKNKREFLQIRDYIQKYTHNNIYIYIYSCIKSCTTYTSVYYNYISSIVAYYSCNNL